MSRRSMSGSSSRLVGLGQAAHPESRDECCGGIGAKRWEEKTSCIHVLYAEDSSEEHIYGKVSWDGRPASSRIDIGYGILRPNQSSKRGRRNTPLPTEMQIDMRHWSLGALSGAVRRDRTELRYATECPQPWKINMLETRRAWREAVIAIKGRARESSRSHRNSVSCWCAFP